MNDTTAARFDDWKRQQAAKAAAKAAYFAEEARRRERQHQAAHAARVESNRQAHGLTGYSCGGAYTEPAGINSDYPDYRDFED